MSQPQQSQEQSQKDSAASATETVAELEIEGNNFSISCYHKYAAGKRWGGKVLGRLFDGLRRPTDAYRHVLSALDQHIVLVDAFLDAAKDQARSAAFNAVRLEADNQTLAGQVGVLKVDNRLLADQVDALSEMGSHDRADYEAQQAVIQKMAGERNALQEALAHVYEIAERVEVPSIARLAKAALDGSTGGAEILKKKIEEAKNATSPARQLPKIF